MGRGTARRDEGTRRITREANIKTHGVCVFVCICIYLKFIYIYICIIIHSKIIYVKMP